MIKNKRMKEATVEAQTFGDWVVECAVGIRIWIEIEVWIQMETFGDLV